MRRETPHLVMEANSHLRDCSDSAEVQLEWDNSLFELLQLDSNCQMARLFDGEEQFIEVEVVQPMAIAFRCFAESFAEDRLVYLFDIKSASSFLCQYGQAEILFAQTIMKHHDSCSNSNNNQPFPSGEEVAPLLCILRLSAVLDMANRLATDTWKPEMNAGFSALQDQICAIRTYMQSMLEQSLFVSKC